MLRFLPNDERMKFPSIDKLYEREKRETLPFAVSQNGRMYRKSEMYLSRKGIFSRSPLLSSSRRIHFDDVCAKQEDEMIFHLFQLSLAIEGDDVNNTQKLRDEIRKIRKFQFQRFSSLSLLGYLLASRASVLGMSESEAIEAHVRQCNNEFITTSKFGYRSSAIGVGALLQVVK